MRCPACQQPLREGDAACAACSLTLASLDAHLGIPPQLTAPVADMAKVLSLSAHRALAESVRALEQRFPEVRAVVITAAVPANFTPELYSFWLFNRTGLFSAVEKGGDNHGVMLLCDTEAPRCVASIGYGLEPLLPSSALETALTAATSHLLKRNYGSAGTAFFRELERQLNQASHNWPQTFGYSETGTWFESGTGTLIRTDTSTDEDLY
ncbi:TPM domain-containing protein [Brevifollis gellanilyticus]|uniref:TPM domain-containing protein n=1 Tax=Brevifollis gellanilyticus TaxID=748831 RepID=A0A512MHQ3_9BACT|nr:TPM domain-containing protein [Brevifollis gellanilyticus]GEP45861.1 hypothetical protein BGE01nite_51520 [Brevifollis gellanilyticus]